VGQLGRVRLIAARPAAACSAAGSPGLGERQLGRDVADAQAILRQAEHPIEKGVAQDLHRPHVGAVMDIEPRLERQGIVASRPKDGAQPIRWQSESGLPHRKGRSWGEWLTLFSERAGSAPVGSDARSHMR
jgi:hypothetical protein